MAEYIDRDGLINDLKDLPEQERIEYMGIYDCIKSTTAADVVEVVRCGQCKHAYINSFSAKEGIALCRFLTNHAIDGTSFVRKQDDYCSYGERWDGDTK